MTDSDLDAASHLKTIRALMERATVYRAISAPGALFAGVLTLLACGILLRLDLSSRFSAIGFLWFWTGILVVVSAFNFFLIYKSAKRRGDPFASAGMKMALRAISPPLLAGFVLSALSAYKANQFMDIVSFWILFYGLGLLAMGSFAPRSLLALGSGFFCCGLLSFFPEIRAFDGRLWQASVTCMAVTFGGLHVIYAIWVFMVKRNGAEPDDDRA